MGQEGMKRMQVCKIEQLDTLLRECAACGDRHSRIKYTAVFFSAVPFDMYISRHTNNNLHSQYITKESRVKIKSLHWFDTKRNKIPTGLVQTLKMIPTNKVT